MAKASEPKVTLDDKLKVRLSVIVAKHNFNTGKNFTEEEFVEDLVKRVIIENEVEEFKTDWRKQKEEDFKAAIESKRQEIEDGL
jgi:hypothetical protein